MKTQDSWGVIHFGIRSKLIALFVAIKVLPLIMLAYFAWQGVEQLGLSLSQETEQLADEVKTVLEIRLNDLDGDLSSLLLVSLALFLLAHAVVGEGPET